MERGLLLSLREVTLKLRLQGEEPERKDSGKRLAVGEIGVFKIRPSSWELNIGVMVPNLPLTFFYIFFTYAS